MEKVEGGICLMCREWIPAGKDEHTCFDAYEELQQRVRELEEIVDDWRSENARLRGNWWLLKEWVASEDTDRMLFYQDVQAKMQQLEAEPFSRRREDGDT